VGVALLLKWFQVNLFFVMDFVSVGAWRYPSSTLVAVANFCRQMAPLVIKKSNIVDILYIHFV
jgi:hypothetical protein